MRRLFIIISIIATTLSAQPKETVEFQLNTISGQVLNILHQTPVENLKVELLSGNNLLKGSLLQMKMVILPWKMLAMFGNQRSC